MLPPILSLVTQVAANDIRHSKGDCLCLECRQAAGCRSKWERRHDRIYNDMARMQGTDTITSSLTVPCLVSGTESICIWAVVAQATESLARQPYWKGALWVPKLEESSCSIPKCPFLAFIRLETPADQGNYKPPSSWPAN